MSRCILIALILFTVAWLQPAHREHSPALSTCWDGTRLLPAPGRWYKVASRTDDYWPGFYQSPTRKPSPSPRNRGCPRPSALQDWQALYDDISSPDGKISLIMLRSLDADTNGHANNVTKCRYSRPRGLPRRELSVWPKPVPGLSSMIWPLHQEIRADSNDRVGGMYLYIPHDQGHRPWPSGEAADYPWDQDHRAVCAVLDFVDKGN